MPIYEVVLNDRTLVNVDGADTYRQEGQMTTFFATRRGVVDSWSTRLASYRTSDIVSIRRLAVPDCSHLTPAAVSEGRHDLVDQLSR